MNRYQKHRIRIKELIVASLGGKCVCCGYNKSMYALDCHHIDPKTKTASLSDIRRNHGNWKDIVKELRKCVLVCANCHREIECGIRQLPQMVTRFDETYVDVVSRKKKKVCEIISCLYCKKKYQKRGPNSKYCSHACSSKNSKRKVEIRPTKKELALLISTLSWCAIGRKFGVSDNCIRKWAKIYNIVF